MTFLFRPMSIEFLRKFAVVQVVLWFVFRLFVIKYPKIEFGLDVTLIFL